MTMTLRDVMPGMCWRFTSKTAPDNKPTYTLTDVEADDEYEGPRVRVPDGWDDHYWEDPDGDDHSSFFQKHHTEPVQLLVHYKKAPEGRPVEEYEAVPAKKVRSSQWFLGGEWQERTAKSIASSLNRLEVRPTSYHSAHGPSLDGGWAVVRALPEKAAPFVANPPRVLSCVDPLKDLSDAVFVLETFRVDGRTGAQCLARFEQGQQTESIACTGVPGSYVCTNADCGMTSAQVEHARLLWAATLKLKVARQKAADAERERMRIVVDYIDID